MDFSHLPRALIQPIFPSSVHFFSLTWTKHWSFVLLRSLIAPSQSPVFHSFTYSLPFNVKMPQSSVLLSLFTLNTTYMLLLLLLLLSRFSRVQLRATPWTAAYQAPPSMGFSRQEDWSGVPLLSPHLYAAAAKSLQSCPTLCDPRDGSPQGSPVPGTLQARTLEWVAISFSNAGKWKVKVKSLSRVQFLAAPWTAAYQAPPSMGFSRQEYWSGVPLQPLPNVSYQLRAFLQTHTTHATPQLESLACP